MDPSQVAPGRHVHRGRRRLGAHGESRRVADGQERRDARHRPGPAAATPRGVGLAAPTLKARRTLGERAASGARASRARRSRATERAAFSTAGARATAAPGLRAQHALGPS